MEFTSLPRMLIFLLPLTFCLVSGDVNEKNVLSKTPVSSSFVGLEVPLVGAAASPQQRKVISLHHNPSDENNLERLCNDPFHSFLCKPAGRRRRIDGRLRPGAVLPPGVLAAASNRREEKQPLEEGSALLPTSQVEDRAYLPPPNQKPPIQQHEPQYLPPEPPQKIESLPSNPFNFYIKDFRTTQKPYTTRQPENEPKEYVTYRPLTKMYLPIKLTEPESQTQQIPLSSNVQPKNTYLPTDDSNVLPESTNLSPNIEGGALLSEQNKPQSKNNEESHTLERLCNDPFHSFLCKPLKARKRIDGKIRPGAKLPPNVLLTSDSIRRETKVLPLEEGGALLPSSLPSPKSQSPNLYNPKKNQGNSFDLSYLANQNEFNKMPSSKPFYNRNPKSFILQTNNTPQIQDNTFFSTISPTSYPGTSSTNSNINPQIGYNYKSTNIPPPITGSAGNHTKLINAGFLNPTLYSKQNIKPSSSLSRNNYLKPNSPLLLPTQTTFSAVRPNLNYQQAYPSNQQETILPSQSSGYSYPKPTVTFSTQNHFIQAPKPEVFPESRPSNVQQITFLEGYNYPLPLKVFPLPPVPNNYPSTVTLLNPSTQSVPTQNVQYLSPTNINENTVKLPIKDGYVYEKPAKELSYTTTARPSPTNRPDFEPIKTTKKPNYEIQSPTNNEQTIIKPQENGYYYSKPTVLFTYPTKPTVQTPTTPTTAKASYQYPSSSNIQNVVSLQDNGYHYDKPSNSFTYPTTSTTTPRPFIEYPNPSNIQQNVIKPQNNGYTYDKPSSSFSYPASNPTFTFSSAPIKVTTQRVPSTTRKPSTLPQPIPNYDYPNPTNVQESIIRPQDGGYHYNKPSSIFTYPTKAPFTTTTSNNLENFPNPTNVEESIAQSPENHGYNYPRPMKPFPLPSRSNEPLKYSSNAFGTQQQIRFGERINHSIQTVTRDSHDEDFKPLRNFEVI